MYGDLGRDGFTDVAYLNGVSDGNGAVLTVRYGLIEPRGAPSVAPAPDLGTRFGQIDVPCAPCRATTRLHAPGSVAGDPFPELLLVDGAAGWLRVVR